MVRWSTVPSRNDTGHKALCPVSVSEFSARLYVVNGQPVLVAFRSIFGSRRSFRYHLRGPYWANLHLASPPVSPLLARPTNKSRRIRGEWFNRFLDMLLMVLPRVLVMYRNRNVPSKQYCRPRPSSRARRLHTIDTRTCDRPH